MALILALLALLALAGPACGALYNIPVPEVDIAGQLHGDPFDSDLRLFMAGNQFVAMDLLVAKFKETHPQYQKVFYVTIPPGKELAAIQAGGMEIVAENTKATSGFQLKVVPDVFTTVNTGHLDVLAAKGIVKEYQVYAHNRLVLMCMDTDPLAGQTLDAQAFYDLLAAPDTTISEPDIITQGIERHIWQMYTDTTKTLFPDNEGVAALNGKMFDPTAVGQDAPESLRRIVYHDKEATGATVITSIHHLETPAYIREGRTRMGPVWVTEVKFQNNRLNLTDVSMIELGALGPDGKYLDRREKVNYAAAAIDPAYAEAATGLPANPAAAEAWIAFLASPAAQEILEGVGFIRATEGELAARVNISTGVVASAPPPGTPLYSIQVPEVDILGQVHGDFRKADLRLFMAGNQFVVMDLLVDEFKAQHPDFSEVFYVTIPPGKELAAIQAGGMEIVADNSLATSGFQLKVVPDVFTTVNTGHLDVLAAKGIVNTPYQVYAHNSLVLMCMATDPLAGQTLDAQAFYDLLAAPDTTISEPDIITQGIERHIWQMYTDTTKTLFPDNEGVAALNGKMFDPTALGQDAPESLRRIVYHDKEATGATVITSIHHLETPAYIREGRTRMGPVWVTEVKFQNNRLNLTDVSMIELGALGPDGKYLDRREKVNYAAAAIDPAYAEAATGLPANPAAAEAWIAFLASPAAQEILEGVGFIRATEGELAARVSAKTPAPTSAPVAAATAAPTAAPVAAATAAPTAAPVAAATAAPTAAPVAAATAAPTAAPVAPTPTSGAASMAASMLAGVIALFAMLI